MTMKTINEISIHIAGFEEDGEISYAPRKASNYKKELRQSAIDDIKELQEKIKKVEICDSFNSMPSGSTYRAQIDYIQRKFNITEDDLK